jgi:superfamily II DNA or RNA helicase
MTRLTIEVDSHLRVRKSALKRAGLSLRIVREAFDHPNPEFFKKERMGLWTGATPKTLSLVEADGDDLLLPRGGLPKLRRILEREVVEFVLVDRTVSGTGPLGLTYRSPPGWELGPDQRSAARFAALRRNGIVLGVCASGKTEILLKAIAELGERTLVLVHTERILSDWVRKASERFGVPEKEIGVLYGKAKRPGNLTIGMIQTVRNLVKRGPKFAKSWGTVVNDEAHHCPATTHSEVINSFPARNRLAATATPKRKDGREGLFYDVFGVEEREKRGGGVAWGPRVLFEITDEDLDRYGRIVPVDVVVVPTEFHFDLNLEEALEEEGFERLPKESPVAAVRRWAKAEKYPGPLNTYGEMLDAMVRNETRRARILEYLLPEIAAGRTSLLLADRRELCVEIQAWLRRRKIDCSRLMGGRDSKDQDRTVAGLEDGSLQVAVGTTVADEGMDVKRLDRGFGLTPTASNPGRLTQQTGRLKRLHSGKSDAVYFYFWDRKVRGLRRHAREVAKAIRPPHRVWFSEKPGKREPLTPELLRRLEEE